MISAESTTNAASQLDMTGSIQWLEIPIHNFSRAAAFYAGVLGWTCTAESEPTPAPGVDRIYGFEAGPLHGAFLLMKDKGQQIPNFEDGQPERVAVLPSFSVPSIEEAIQKAERLGGKRHVDRTAVEEYGFFARIIDSEGNLLGIWADN